MPRIHCLNNISAKGTDLLPEAYELTGELQEADGILVRSAALHDTEFPSQLLAIARAGAGVNNIPLDRCAEEGIVVFNTPGANANAVKELVLCGMLLASRGIVGGIEWCQQNADDPEIGASAEKAKKQFAGKEILGKKLGVIGLGAIGALVANAGLALGMEVYGYDPYVSAGAAWRIDPAVKYVTDLTEICAECDYLTIHVPAMPSTKGMIGEDELRAMKDDAVLLNFSRDSLVDEAALVQALDSNSIGCYVTDFATPGLMKAQNAIVIPHLGASTEEAEENCAMMAVEQIVDYIDNGNIKNSVNYPTISLGAQKAGCQRIVVLLKNEDGLADRVTEALEAVKRIANKAEAARGDYAVTLYDVDGALTQEEAEKAFACDGIVSYRLL